MKRLFIATLVSLMVCQLTAAIADKKRFQVYVPLWEQAYDQWKKQGLPRSAIATADKIFRMAEARKDTATMLRASLFGMYHRNQLSPDSFFVDLPKLEAWTTDSTLSAANRAIIHSVLGGIYQQAANRGVGYLRITGPERQDSSPAETPPSASSLQAWSRTAYLERAFRHYRMSVRNLEELYDTNEMEACDIIYDGWWSKRFFGNSLMNTIGRRAISGLQALATELGNVHRQSRLTTFPIRSEAFMTNTPEAPLSEFDCMHTVMHIFHRMLHCYSRHEAPDARMLTELNRLTLYPSTPPKREALEQLLQHCTEQHPHSDVVYTICRDLADWYAHNRLYAEELELIREALAKHQAEKNLREKHKQQHLPTTGDVYQLWNRMKELTSPYLHLSGPFRMAYPGDTLSLTVSHRRIDRLDLRLLRIEAPTDSIYKYRQDTTWLKAHARPASRQSFGLKCNTAYRQADTTLCLRLPEAGNYLIEGNCGATSGDETPLVTVSSFWIEQMQLNADESEIRILDSRSGHPVPDATLTIFARTGQNLFRPVMELKSAADGRVILPDKELWKTPDDWQVYYIRVSTGKEDSMLYEELRHFRLYAPSSSSSRQECLLMTDRNLYRPGQEVWVKGIIYRHEAPADTPTGWKQHRLVRTAPSDAPLKLALIRNGKELQSCMVTPGDFGSFSTRFVLPDGMSGRFTLELQNGNGLTAMKAITVEEYKRPKFGVQLLPPDTPYALGDSVTLRGEAYTLDGQPVTGGTVNYTVQTGGYGTMRKLGGESFHIPAHRISGSTTTDAEGKFHIRIRLEEDPDRQEAFYRMYTYRIEATVTSPSGESRDAVTELRLSNIPLQLRTDMPDHWEKGKSGQQLTFNVTNLNDSPVDTSVTYRLTLGGKSLLCGTAPAGVQLDMPEFSTLPDGAYTLYAATAIVGSRDSARNIREIVIHSPAPTKVPTGLSEWVHLTKHTFREGEPAILQFGTTRKNVFATLEIFTEGGRAESHDFTLSDTVLNIPIAYRSDYGKGIRSRISFVQNGLRFEQVQKIETPRPDKRLVLKWKSFRNKLLPGSNEEWTLSIHNPDGTPARAEVLATMYDKSLDQIRPGLSGWENWNPHQDELTFYPYHKSILSRPMGFSISMPFPIAHKEVPILWRYADIVRIYTAFGHRGFYAKESYAANKAVMLTGAAPRLNSARIEYGATAEETVEHDDASTEEDTGTSGMVMRENFNETAFFYPHLLTGPDGEVKISFTLPESLTTWKFRALAHTQQLDCGSLTDEAIAYKTFTVSPNLPRFVRQGDETTLTALISNRSAKELKGKATMELYDPESGKTLLKKKAAFCCPAGKIVPVRFSFTLSESEITLPACRITAESGQYSDGEQHYLPVLTDKTWVTESLPLTITAPGITTVSLDSLAGGWSRTAGQKRLTIEFTGNPEWAAIQALPTLETPSGENAHQWAAAWYVQQIARHIVESEPQIRDIITLWKQDETNEAARQSELLNDPELKTILAEETPWLAEATDETERRKQLVSLFDRNMQDYKQEQCIRKLQELQTTEGGWGWYRDMGTNRHITTLIVEMMQRAKFLTGKELPANAQLMLERAEKYLWRELQQEYDNLQKDSTLRLSESALQFLYTQHLNSKPATSADSRRVEELVRLIPTQTGRLSIAAKAHAAIILHRTDRKEEAQLMLRSLMEHSVDSPEMGRYFDTHSAGAGNRSRQMTAQVAALEALSLVMPQKQEVMQEMKQWLMMQKRTQDWGNLTCTTDAIYALVGNRGSLNRTSASAILRLDGEKIGTGGKGLSGLDHFKKSFTEQEMKKLPAVLTIDKPQSGMAWGAVYVQYLEKTNKVKSSDRLAITPQELYKRPLSIEQQLLVEEVEDGKPHWRPVTSQTSLKVGDKVTSRLIIRADRSMDFVQIKEERAACVEPTDSHSAYRFGQVGYYCEVKDASTRFYIDRLPKGSTLIETTYHIDRPGTYRTGITTVQCAYAPEYTANTGSITLQVEP